MMAGQSESAAVTAPSTTILIAGSKDSSWITKRHLWSLNLRILVLLSSAATLGFDSSIMNGLLSLYQWNDYFNTPRSSLLGLINAVMPLGLLLTALPAAWISDRYGRRTVVIIGAVVQLVASITQSSAQNKATFIIARLLIGVGMEFTLISSPVLISELAYPSQRGKITSLYNCFYYLGSIASSWITFGTFNLTTTWSWRIPSALQALLPLIQFICIWVVPESPRWLVKNDRSEEAFAILTKYHAGGDDKLPLVISEMEEITRHLEMEQRSASMSWSCLWKTKADRKRLFICCFIPFMTQWAGNGVITIYLSLVLDSVGITKSFDQTLINGILQIFNGFAAVLGAMMVDRIGRRKLFLWGSSGMLVSFIIWTGCAAVNYQTGDQLLGYVVVVFIFIYFFHYDISFTPVPFTYVTEILPFHTRAKGFAIVNFGGGLAIMFNTFINPIAMNDIHWKYYIVYCILIAIILVVIFFNFPETKGLSLEQIADIFESDRPAWKRYIATPADQENSRTTIEEGSVATTDTPKHG